MGGLVHTQLPQTCDGAGEEQHAVLGLLQAPASGTSGGEDPADTSLRSNYKLRLHYVYTSQDDNKLGFP